MNHPKLSNHAKSLLENDKRIAYKQFGTKTGRLTTKKGSFPILTLPQPLRKAIKPQNDFYVEIDFNGAEVRTLLGLLDKPQPTGDIHEFHLENIFNTLTSRREAKEAFFAWLYGSKKAANVEQSKQLDTYYEKHKILNKFYNNGTVTTLFGKKIPNVSQHHAVKYLLSRYGDSEVAFLIHDAIVLDMRKEDLGVLKDILKLTKSTNFGEFVVNVKKGKNLGEMSPWIK